MQHYYNCMIGATSHPHLLTMPFVTLTYLCACALSLHTNYIHHITTSYVAYPAPSVIDANSRAMVNTFLLHNYFHSISKRFICKRKHNVCMHALHPDTDKYIYYYLELHVHLRHYWSSQNHSIVSQKTKYDVYTSYRACAHCSQYSACAHYSAGLYNYYNFYNVQLPNHSDFATL